MQVHTTPPPHWDRLSASYGNLDWNCGVVVTYGAEIYCASGKIDPDVLVHEMVHVEQQRGQDMEKLLERYMTDPEYVREVETPAFKAQAAFLDATEKDPEVLKAKKRHYAKTMVQMYKSAFTMESASAIMGI